MIDKKRTENGIAEYLSECTTYPFHKQKNQTEIPEWAWKQAREIVVEQWSKSFYLRKRILAGDFDKKRPIIRWIAAAIMEADKDATERCLSIILKSHKPAQSRDVNVMMQESAVNDALAQLEDAIRKGAPHD